MKIISNKVTRKALKFTVLSCGIIFAIAGFSICFLPRQAPISPIVAPGALIIAGIAVVASFWSMIDSEKAEEEKMYELKKQTELLSKQVELTQKAIGLLEANYKKDNNKSRDINEAEMLRSVTSGTK